MPEGGVPFNLKSITSRTFLFNVIWLSRKPKLNAQIKITKMTGFLLARE